MAISDMGTAQIREGLASKQFTACEVPQASLRGRHGRRAAR